MEKHIPVIDKIGSQIPGYVGYEERDKRRYCDAAFRNQLSAKFDQIEEQLHIKINSTISIKDHVLMNDLGSCMREIRNLKSRIEIVPYHEVSSSTLDQLRSEDLDQLYAIDLELIKNIDTLALNVTESRSEIIHDLIGNIDRAIERRLVFIGAI